MKRFTAISATAIAAALALAGCGSTTGSDSGTMSGMDHNTTSASPSAVTSAAADHNSTDVMFAQAMIPHHEQAVRMSEIMLAKDNLDPQITQLAEDIRAAQGPEIDMMNAWLAAWDEPSKMSGDHGMDGMMSEDDMGALETAQGAEASKLFLTQMIEHHKGAVMMAEEEAANGSNPESVALAKTIVKDQTAEIEKMSNLLAAL